MRNSLQFVIKFRCEFCLIISISQLFVIVDAVDGPALVAHLHEKVGVIVGFFGVEMDVGGTIDLELLVDAFVHMLLVETFAMDSHLLDEVMRTETGSLTFLAL